MSIKVRLIIMNFLQFAVWGAYLTSMGSYLISVNLASHIGIFYAMQGIVSLFMPAILGIIADRWIPAQKLLSFSHFTAALFMALAGYYGMTAGTEVEFSTLFTFYSLSVAFYMPTLALSNSVAYTVLDKAGLDTVKTFPPIRIFGTIGFISSMWIVDLLGLQNTYGQFFACAAIGVVYGAYALTLPNCPVSKAGQNKSLVEALGLRAFTLFKQKKMAIFFIFSMLLGVSLQITNGFANPYISSFGSIPEYANTFGVQHANILISLSQVSETLCILLIPFFLKRFGIKQVMLIAMFAWVLRFGLFGTGNPGSGVWMFVLSMIVYGVAFDFFNISGSLFVDKETDKSIRSSAQGLFVIMTNGFGATIGTLGAQVVVDYFVDFKSSMPQVTQWQSSWFVFAGYALIVAIVFAFVFKYKHHPEKMNKQ
ncbi:nucleoside permease [Bacteroides sp. UBA939]|uniref:nucleoside permease n=1 Tax=Bacteroides sp. UBA939 TaxID=1946092 RepID=UPI0025BCD11C|nr:nucleoside permease [Bacteroides sp. UBA939]